MRTRGFALALALLLASCAPAVRPPPPVTPPAPAAPGFEPVAGRWVAGNDANLRSSPTTSAPVIGRLGSGSPVKVLGRVRGTDWIAVPYGGSTGYVRLHLLRLQDTDTPTARGSSTVIPKAQDNSGPRINAAPRGRIEAAPIPAQ